MVSFRLSYLCLVVAEIRGQKPETRKENRSLWLLSSDLCPLGLALTLLVAGIFADHADNALPLDELALIANPPHARSHLHGAPKTVKILQVR
jgi:hypothetical protein